MKNSKIAVLQRQKKIWEKLLKDQTIFVEQLAEEYGVSTITLRRDLDTFEQKGLIERFHGGAKLVHVPQKRDPSLMKNADLQITKRLIAKKAAEMVEEGDTIFVNSSTTALAMFEFLSDKKVTIITNNANSFCYADTGKIEIVFTGGMINSIKHSMVGEVAVQMIKTIHANKCFIGVSGINYNGDISTAILQETMVNIAMMEQTNHNIVILADSSKIGVQHNFTIGSLNQVTHLITDYNINEEQKKFLKNTPVELLIAQSS